MSAWGCVEPLRGSVCCQWVQTKGMSAGVEDCGGGPSRFSQETPPRPPALAQMPPLVHRSSLAFCQLSEPLILQEPAPCCPPWSTELCDQRPHKGEPGWGALEPALAWGMLSPQPLSCKVRIKHTYLFGRTMLNSIHLAFSKC